MHNAESGDGDRMSRSSGVGAPLRPEPLGDRSRLPGVDFNLATFDVATVLNVDLLTCAASWLCCTPSLDGGVTSEP